MTLYRKYPTRSGWKLAADKCRDVWAALKRIVVQPNAGKVSAERKAT